MRKLRKTLIIVVSSVVIIVVVVILSISPITKYLIEKYDIRYTGRQITMDWAYVNPFTGYIHFNNIKVYELKSDSIFFSAHDISANLAILRLFSKTYELSELTINHPSGIIIQDKNGLNFDDLIEKYSSKGNVKTTMAPVHFSIRNIVIKDGIFYYREKATPINYFIKNVNIESTGKRWNSDTIAATFSFLSGIESGGMKGNFTINIINGNYRLAVVAQKFDLNILEQYLKDLTNFGVFSANLDADMKVKGNFKASENVTFTGLLAINDFHFGKNPADDYGSFKKLALSIIELSPKNHKYLFDSVSLNQPYFKYELYDHLDNIQTMFGAYGSHSGTSNSSDAKFNLILVIGNYIKALSENFFRSDYKLNRLAIYKGDLKFNDYSPSEVFEVEMKPVYLIADSINKNNKRVNVSLKSGIFPYGKATVALSINPKDTSDFDMHYYLQKLPAALFNPYMISQTSYQFDRGTFELQGSWQVRNGNIKSDNHLLIIDPRITKRIKNKDANWIPMWLVMALIRERGNVIDYSIPISGNLKNPKFHLHDVLFDAITNIFVKPATTPYGIKIKTIESEVEKTLLLTWEMRHSSPREGQEKFIKKMADFLSKNPEAAITISPQYYALKEKEYILYFEAKKKYFLKTNNKNASSFSKVDSLKVDKMSAKDASFIRYLNKYIHDSLVFTVQEKCTRFIGRSLINSKFELLNKQRKDAFLHYFKEKGVENRVRIAKANTVIPYNGFSFYKIEYKGEYPVALMKAYRKMNELNKEAPRKKFFKEREKSRVRL